MDEALEVTTVEEIEKSEQAAPKKPEKTFDAVDVAFAFAALFCGFLYWNLIRIYAPGAGVTVFAVIMIALSFIYLSKSKIKQNSVSIVCLLLTIASAAQFAIFDNRIIGALNFVFLSAVFVYWICVSTGRRIDEKLSVYIIGDAIKQVFSMPFRNFGCCVSGISKGFSKYTKIKGVLPAIAGVMLFLPLLIFVTELLISADLAFENFVKNIFDYMDVYKIIIYAVQFTLGIPVAFYLYGLIYGNVKGRYAEKITVESVDKAAKIVKFAPKTAIYTVLTAFNAIYCLFFAVQAAYLFSAFNGNLPEVFTYAEYARRGFFELCMVAGINLGILIISHLTVKKELGEEPKLLRAGTLGTSLFTILLIATGLSKMVMYINAYGLTQLRVFTSWFMVLLLFIFAVICIRQFKKFNASKFIVVGFVVMFMALSYGNVDGLIAKYNISRYEAGTLPTFDVEMIAGLSDAAVPHIYDLYLRTDESDFNMRRQLKSSIIEWSGIRMSGFREFNFQRHRADEIREIMNDSVYLPGR